MASIRLWVRKSGIPLVCESACRTVGPRLSSGLSRYLDSGASRSIRPAWASTSTSAAVTVSVASPMPIIASGTSGTPAPSTQTAPVHEPCGDTTAAVTPRIPAAAATSAIRCTAACSRCAREAGSAAAGGCGHGNTGGAVAVGAVAVGAAPPPLVAIVEGSTDDIDGTGPGLPAGLGRTAT